MLSEGLKGNFGKKRVIENSPQNDKTLVIIHSVGFKRTEEYGIMQTPLWKYFKTNYLSRNKISSKQSHFHLRICVTLLKWCKWQFSQNSVYMEKFWRADFISWTLKENLMLTETSDLHKMMQLYQYFFSKTWQWIASSINLNPNFE